MYHFIVNVRGANGRALLAWKKLEGLLKKQKISYKSYVSYKSGYATELAKQISSLATNGEKVDLVVLGGDGTINEVINGITDFSKVNFGLIPTGSGNDFARGVGFPVHNIKKALKVLLASKKEITMDLGEVIADDKKRYFAISSGLGMDAIVCKKALSSKLKFVLNCLHLGKFIYIIYTVQTLFSMKYYDVETSLGDFKKLIFVAAMNLRAEGGNVKMAPDATCSNRKLTMCAVNGIPKGISIFAFILLIFGLHKKVRGFTLKTFDNLKINSKTLMTLHTDGEYVGEVKQVEWNILPSVLTLLK